MAGDCTVKFMQVAICAVASSFLLTGIVYAVSGDSAVSAFILRDKLDSAQRDGSPQEQLLREEARRAKAAERVDKIRDLSMEQIAVWNASEQTDEVLEKLSSASRAVPPPSSTDSAIPRNRLIRLSLSFAAVLVLSAMYYRRMRMSEQAGRKKSQGPRR